MADGVMEKDPDDWETGDQPATGPQYGFYTKLCNERSETVKPQNTFTKASIAKEIDRLKASQTKSAGT